MATGQKWVTEGKCLVPQMEGGDVLQSGKGGGGYCWMMVEWRWARMLCVLFIETLGNGKSKVWQCEY